MEKQLLLGEINICQMHFGLDIKLLDMHMSFTSMISISFNFRSMFFNRNKYKHR